MNDLIFLNFQEAKQPLYIEKRGTGIVYYGEDNAYPDYILNLYNKSAKHNAIVNSKVNYISGNGWAQKDADAAADLFIKEANPYESLDDLTRKISTDIEIFGGAYIEVIWSMVGGMIDSLYHIDYTKIRTNKDNTQFYYKENWQDRKSHMQEIAAFNTSVRTGKQILFIKEYRPSNPVYSKPVYFAALNYIESDIEISKHTLGNAQTGFSASKLITLPNGEPTDEEKRNIERRFTSRFSGSDGKKFILSFVQDAARKPLIEDLGASDITKEDFSNVDSMIQQNIFSAHEISSPSIFGIAEPGKLGSRTEMRDAYEIFKNTYVNGKQRFIESVINKLAVLKGVTSQLYIKPVEPISYEFSENALMQVMTKDEIRERIGLPPIEQQMQQESINVNDNIKNLTGRQHQQLLRIIRQFGQGKISREQATTLLKSGLGMNDDEISTMLGTDEQFAESISDDELLQMFSEVGESEDNFNIVKSAPLKFREKFVEVSAKDYQLLDLIKKDPLISYADLGRALKETESEIADRIANLKELGTLEVAADGKLKVTKPLAEMNKPKVVFEVRYKYDWKSIVPSNQRDSAAHPSRAFCVKLMSQKRLYSRKEIERLSAIVGYSVFDRAGGWWNNNGQISPSCRHEWNQVTVIKKN